MGLTLLAACGAYTGYLERPVVAQTPSVETTPTAAVASIGADTVRRFGGSYRTYLTHPCEEKGEGSALDYWGPAGWLDPLDTGTGDPIVAWTIGQHPVTPVRYVIWYGWIWRPTTGWLPYPDLADQHGPGPEAHVHVCYE